MATKAFVKKFMKKQKQSVTSFEPETEAVKDSNDLARALAWYSSAGTTDKRKKAWVLEYVKENKLDIKQYRKVPEIWFRGTISTVCRMSVRGYNSENSERFIEKNLSELLTRIPEVVVEKAVEVKKKPTIQDRMREQVKTILAEVDFAVDCKLLKNEDNEITPIMVEANVGAPQTKLVMEHVESYLKDFRTVREGRLTDKEMFAAYDMSLTNLRKMEKYLESLTAELERYLGAKKATRKVSVRAKKVVSPTELCKAVVLVEDSVLKPAKIIGSSLAVIYNAKHKRLTYLVAEDAGGLSVKGKSITNFDDKKSKVLRVDRKYKNFIKEINSKNGINALKKLMRDETKFNEILKAKVVSRLSDQVNLIQAV
jgi:hypothetical protein